MANIGTMVAKLALDYSDFQRGITNARGNLNGWQTYTVAVQAQSSKTAGAAAATAAVSSAMAARSTRSALGGLLQGSMGVVGGIARIGISAASAYGSWRLYSLRMKNELMQNQLLTNMLGRGPAGGGAGSLAWLNAMRNGLSSNRSGLSATLKSVLGVSAALAGLGAAAIYGYGAWRKQSASIRTELMQQKVMAEQLRQMRSSGGVMGGGAFGGGLAGGMIGGMAGMALGRVTAAVASVPATALSLASDAEQTGIAFEVMLGSGEKAAAMLAEIKAYADKSPFDLAGANEAAQKLMNYGMQAQDVMPTMRMLGDVAAGDKEKFDRLSTAFGQTTSTGRLMGQDLLQFINAGFNPLQEIAKKTGESMATLKKRMEDGGVSSLEVRDAFAAATSEGGRFFQMTERQSQTLAGLWSTFKDSVSTALRDVGVALMTSVDLKGWLTYFTQVMGQAPFVIRNAGKLLQIEMVDWGVYLMEVVPYGKQAGEQLYAGFVGLWAALREGWKQFAKDSNKFLEEAVIGPKGTFLGVGVKKGGLIDVLTGGKYSVEDQNKGAKPRDAIPDILAVGEKARQDALKSFKLPGNSASEQLTKLKDELKAQITASELGVPKLDAPSLLGGQLGASFTTNTDGKGKKEKEDNAKSPAALRGSSEAAKIFTSGTVTIASKQLNVLEKIEKALTDKNKPENDNNGVPQFTLEVANF